MLLHPIYISPYGVHGVSMIHVKDLATELTEHPLYRSIGDDAALRLFMRSHVFCVWDFMSLLKALQREFTCINVPWLPCGDPEPRRFINEIVVTEESDTHPSGGYVSHFELYHEAMQACGADVAPIDRFVERLRAGQSVVAALTEVELPRGVREFVDTTFGFLHGGAIHRIAAVFAYGREDVIPQMFRRLVQELAHRAPRRWERFMYYLERHIEVDGDEHGPLAQRLVAHLCGNDGQKWREANLAARRALEARIRLWDAILADIRSQERGPSHTLTGT